MLHVGDARCLDFIEDQSVHLVCTSPPYASLVRYPPRRGQLGNLQGYDVFLEQLDRVWAECLRVLVPGGRIACVVGDVCIPRRRSSDRRHHVLPLSADIQVRARAIGLDCLTPIRWLKINNIRMECSKSSAFLGRPNRPNGIVKNDVEHILFLRKPGGYRKPTARQERLSAIDSEDYFRWFSPVWEDVKSRTRAGHPAPYPIEVPRRLIRMFSFVGDTVLDPFAGTGTTALAALETDRSSISVEIEPRYASRLISRLEAARSELADSSSGKRATAVTIESQGLLRAA
jgi:site-specific DNA-methyltransferase (adenine-specific)